MKTKLIVSGIILTGILLAFLAWRQKDTVTYVAVINGGKISYGEYMIYFREQQLNFERVGGKDIWLTKLNGEPAFQVAKQNALDSLIYTKTMTREAEKNGLTPNFSAFKAEADTYYESLTQQEKEIISYDNCLSAMRDKHATIMYRGKLLEEFTVDPADFEEYYDSYLAQNLEEVYRAEVIYVWLALTEENIVLAEDIYRQAQQGSDFESLIVEYSDNRVISPTDLYLLHLGMADKIDVLKMDIGQFSPPIEAEEGVFIVYLVDKEPLVDIESLRRELYIGYKSGRENDYISNRYANMLKSAASEKISQTWDRIELIKY